MVAFNPDRRTMRPGQIAMTSRMLFEMGATATTRFTALNSYLGYAPGQDIIFPTTAIGIAERFLLWMGQQGLESRRCPGGHGGMGLRAAPSMRCGISIAR
jgi:hypothetical protein